MDKLAKNIPLTETEKLIAEKLQSNVGLDSDKKVFLKELQNTSEL